MLEKNGYLTPGQQQMLYHRHLHGNLASNPIKIPDNPSVVGHIFRNASGHYSVDTPANRSAIESTVRQENYIGEAHGANWYARTNPDGTQNWAKVWDGNITDGGLNSVPIPLDQILP